MNTTFVRIVDNDTRNMVAYLKNVPIPQYESIIELDYEECCGEHEHNGITIKDYQSIRGWYKVINLQYRYTNFDCTITAFCERIK